jgi:hypothetical protein
MTTQLHNLVPFTFFFIPTVVYSKREIGLDCISCTKVPFIFNGPFLRHLLRHWHRRCKCNRCNRSAIASFADIIAPFASKDACEVPAKDVMMPSNAKRTSIKAKGRECLCFARCLVFPFLVASLTFRV